MAQPRPPPSRVPQNPADPVSDLLRYSRGQWLDQLGTHSDHIALPSPELVTLLDAVGTAIDRLGGSITVRYETRLISAQRAE